MNAFFKICLLSLVLPLLTVAESHVPEKARRHNELANRRRTNATASDAPVRKRDGSGVAATWYDVGLGACGQNNVPSDFIIALSHLNYGEGYPGPECFKMVTISSGGKQTQAQLMDECMGCCDECIDMSTGLFQFFNPLSVGEFTVDWWFSDGSGGGAPAPTTSKAKPAPTTTWQPPPPSTTWTPPPSTSSSSKWVAPTTSSQWSSSSSSAWSSSSTWSSSSSSKSKSSSSSSWSSSSSSSSWSSTSTSATPTPTPASAQNLASLSKVIVDTANVLVIAAAAAN